MKDEMRPCVVDGQNALFHCWGQAGVEKKLKSGEYGVVNKIYGVVEFEDGSCAQVIPELIVFDDKEVKNLEYVVDGWIRKKEEE